ncbi:hypothetical protein BDD12DRAFT_842249 [Trichophaea hybrida]|nr:hypothetical protein BDD12DRAFT_842249 [Trichophaea hybrida]
MRQVTENAKKIPQRTYTHIILITHTNIRITTLTNCLRNMVALTYTYNKRRLYLCLHIHIDMPGRQHLAFRHSLTRSIPIPQLTVHVPRAGPTLTVCILVYREFNLRMQRCLLESEVCHTHQSVAIKHAPMHKSIY